MSREFILPDLGEGLTEAEIVAWLVAPGDEVAIDQPIVELESAKSVVQLPTPFAGVVESLGGEVGEVIHAGSVLMTLAAVGAESDPTPAAAVSPAVDGSADASAAEPASEGSGAVLIGYGTKQSMVTKRHASAPARFGRRPAAGGGSSAARTVSGGSRLDSGRRSPVVSPIVRRIAREHGFDASQLDGSGPDHLVMRRDVESFISDELGTAPAPAATSAAPLAPTTAQAAAPSHTAPSTDEGDRRVPLDRTARAAAAHFARSRREIPEATVWMDVDATELLAARRQLQEATGERYGVTALVARFVVAGLRKHPSLNSSYDPEREELVLHSAVNLGLAAQTPRGLLVPVVHGAERMSLRELRDAIGARSEQSASVPSRPQRSPAAPSRSTTTARSASTAPRRSSTTPRPRCSASGASSSAPGWSTASSRCEPSPS